MGRATLSILHALRGGGLVVSLFACVATAHGQTPPVGSTTAKTSATTDTADTWFEKGSSAFDAGRLDEARELFGKAWAAKKTHDIAANLGIVEKKLGRSRDAAEHLAAALRLLPPTERDAVRKALQTHFAQVRSLVGAVKIEVNVDGARVTVGTREEGSSPLGAEVFVDPGRVTVHASREGYRDAEQTVDVAKGGAQAVVLSMEALPVIVPSATATASTGLTIAPSSRNMVPAFVGAGAAIAVAAVGGVLLGLAESSRADLIATTPRRLDGSLVCARDPAVGASQAACDALRDKMRGTNALGQGGVGLLVSAGLLGLGAVGYALFWPAPSKPAATTWVPVVTTSGGGIVCSGSF